MTPTSDATTRQLHRRAKKETIAVEAVGVLALAVGIWAILNNPPGPLQWLMVLAIAGPIMMFLGFVAFYTYLEGIEEERYFPDR